MEKGMSKITQKFISTLIIMVMMMSMAMPLTVNAASYTIKQMKLNTIVFFTGETYSSIDYSCKRGVKETFTEQTAGIVWKINRLKNSIVVQLSDTKFRTIPVGDNIKGIRAEEVLDINVSTIEQLQQGDLNLNIDFKGIETEVIIENHALVNIEKTDNGVTLKVGREAEENKEADYAFSKVTVIKEGEEPVPFYIIKDASGNISLDIEGQKITAGAEAEIFEKITVGDTAELAIVDNKIVANNTLAIYDTEGSIYNTDEDNKGHEYLQIDTNASIGLNDQKDHLVLDGGTRLEIKDEEILQVDGEVTVGKGTEEGRKSLELTGNAIIEYKDQDVLKVDAGVEAGKDEEEFFVDVNGSISVPEDKVEDTTKGDTTKEETTWKEVLGGEGKLSYDPTQENADLMAGGKVVVNGTEKFNNLETPTNTQVITKIKSLISRIGLLFE